MRQAVLHAVGKFLRHAAGLFFQPDRFIQDDRRIFMKIGKKRDRRHIFAAHHGGHLICRVDMHGLQVFNGPLAFYIKAADGVDLVVPQLHADRVLLRQRENIQNTAADRELSGRLYLGHAFISQSGQTIPNLCQIQRIARHQRDQTAVDFPRRSNAVHQGVDGGHDQPPPFLQDLLDNGHPLFGEQVSLNVCLVKEHILGRVQKDLRAEAGRVLIDLPGAHIIIGHEQPQRDIRRQFAAQMHLLRIHAPIRLQRAAARHQFLLQFCKLDHLR